MRATASLQRVTTGSVDWEIALRICSSTVHQRRGQQEHRIARRNRGAQRRMKTPVPSGRPMARGDTGAYFGILGPFQPGFSWVVPAAQGTLVYFMSLPEKPSGLHG